MSAEEKLIELFKRVSLTGLDIKLESIYPNIDTFFADLNKYKSLVDETEVIENDKQYKPHRRPFEIYRKHYLNGNHQNKLEVITHFCQDYGDELIKSGKDDHRVLIIGSRILGELYRLMGKVKVEDDEILQSIGIIEQGRIRPDALGRATKIPLLGFS